LTRSSECCGDFRTRIKSFLFLPGSWIELVVDLVGGADATGLGVEEDSCPDGACWALRRRIETFLFLAGPWVEVSEDLSRGTDDDDTASCFKVGLSSGDSCLEFRSLIESFLFLVGSSVETVEDSLTGKDDSGPRAEEAATRVLEGGCCLETGVRG
jgi:hypothetical protein